MILLPNFSVSLIHIFFLKNDDDDDDDDDDNDDGDDAERQFLHSDAEFDLEAPKFDAQQQIVIIFF